MPTTGRGDAKQRVRQVRGNIKWAVYHLCKLPECDLVYTDDALRGIAVSLQGLAVLDSLLAGILNEITPRVERPDVHATFREALVHMPMGLRTSPVFTGDGEVIHG